MAASSPPASTVRQLSHIERNTSAAPGWCPRALNASVSCSERRMMKMNGMITQPMKNGMRQPQAATSLVAMQALRL